MDKRTLKDLLYGQVARIGRALASPKRLEILELLAQGEKSVEALTRELGIDVKLASSHLTALKDACLVTSRSAGKYRVYRLRDTDGMAQLGVALRSVATTHLQDLQSALRHMLSGPQPITAVDRRALLAQARRGEIVVLDVRPAEEYDTAHLPYARSLPLAELKNRLVGLPRDKVIVAYCRGPFCMLSDEAVQRLLLRGFSAQKMADGVSEWRAAGFRLDTSDSGHRAARGHGAVSASAS